MKKLIKISGFYYVIDTEIGVSINGIVWDSKHPNLKDNIIPNEDNSLVPSNGYYKVIATTNSELNLPIIQNIEECEGLVDKEVLVNIIENPEDSGVDPAYFGEPDFVAIVKSIIKEETVEEAAKIFLTNRKTGYENIPKLIRECFKAGANYMKNKYNL